MSSTERHLEYLEEANDVLRTQNHVLATAIKGLIHALPPEIAQDAVESIQLAFRGTLDELNYEDNPYIGLSHDVTYALSHEKKR